MFSQDISLRHISEKKADELGSLSGRWIGMLHIKGAGLTWLNDSLTELQHNKNFSTMAIPDLLNDIVQRGHPVKVHYINGHWLDVNSIEDIDRAGDFTKT